MVKGSETNKVYVSEILRVDPTYQACWANLSQILNKHSVATEFLKGTKDIWCRDYLPVQVSETDFVQFRYEPSYLQDDLHLQSDPKVICRENNLMPRYSQINLDSGNIVNWTDRAILTDRIFDENPFYDRHLLVEEIEELLQAEVILIPQIRSDMTGHADGLVRFVNKDTVLGNVRNMEFKYWTTGVNRILKEHSISYIDVPFYAQSDKSHPHSAIGCYVNYLEVQNLILLPRFETVNNLDQQVFEIFRQIFPDRKIESIPFNSVALEGGVLNCSTWTIKTQEGAISSSNSTSPKAG